METLEPVVVIRQGQPDDTVQGLLTHRVEVATVAIPVNRLIPEVGTIAPQEVLGPATVGVDLQVEADLPTPAAVVPQDRVDPQEDPPGLPLHQAVGLLVAEEVVKL